MCDVGDVLESAADTSLRMTTGGMVGAKDVKSGVDLITGKTAAEAQANIAKAQEEEQRNQRRMAMNAAEATPQELAELNRAIALNETSIARNEKLIASSDPAIIEAGEQALKLLRGEEARTLGPLKNNIAKQEQALRSKLLAQLGPGYENTTAGIQALQAFNEQANSAIVGAQNATIGQLLGVAQDTSSRYGNQTNIANAGTIAGLFGNIQNRKIGAINSTPITAAGSQFVGDLQAARGMTNLINTGINAAATAYGMGAFSPAAGAGGPFAGGGNVQSASNINPYSMTS